VSMYSFLGGPGRDTILRLPVPGFCSAILDVPRLDSGIILDLDRRSRRGLHTFLILRVMTAENREVFIRVERRPKSSRHPVFLITSTSVAASDSVSCLLLLPLSPVDNADQAPVSSRLSWLQSKMPSPTLRKSPLRLYAGSHQTHRPPFMI
jgi:hypothetical protein